MPRYFIGRNDPARHAELCKTEYFPTTPSSYQVALALLCHWIEVSEEGMAAEDAIHDVCDHSQDVSAKRVEVPKRFDVKCKSRGYFVKLVE